MLSSLAVSPASLVAGYRITNQLNASVQPTTCLNGTTTTARIFTAARGPAVHGAAGVQGQLMRGQPDEATAEGSAM